MEEVKNDVSYREMTLKRIASIEGDLQLIEEIIKGKTGEQREAGENIIRKLRSELDNLVAELIILVEDEEPDE